MPACMRDMGKHSNVIWSSESKETIRRCHCAYKNSIFYVEIHVGCLNSPYILKIDK
jgi:hypothetical protein